MSGGYCGGCGACSRCEWHVRKREELRAATLARQIRSLTERRKTVVHRDSRVLRAARQPEVLLAMCEHRGIPMSIPEVALRLGLTVNGVKLIEKRALDKVRLALGVGK